MLRGHLVAYLERTGTRLKRCGSRLVGTCQGYRNLTIPRGFAQAFFAAEDPFLYELASPDEWRVPTSRESVDRLNEAAASLLRKYVDRFYQKARQRWESEHMSYEPLSAVVRRILTLTAPHARASIRALE